MKISLLSCGPPRKMVHYGHSRFRLDSGDTMNNTVTILGARGSMGLGGPDTLRYGGATTCVLVRMSGRAVVLDAGTGFMNPPPDQIGRASCRERV